MTIPKDKEREILRLFHAEKWRPGTIATHVGVHHTTVDRVLGDGGAPRTVRPCRASLADPFVPFIVETLERYPTLTASRLFEMVRQRGYPGSSDGHFRRIVAQHRPRRPAEAYLRLRTLPGEQAQVDWGHFGHLVIGRARRPLVAFVMVLSYSRRIFLRFFNDQRMASFLLGHIEAFEAFGGVPRVLLYDNLKSAVLERRGDAIRFHPTLDELAGHYRFQPRPVAPYRGNEKGRVERAIRYVRSSFFAARAFEDVADLNAQADAWCAGLASDRPCPEEHTVTVRDAFAHERPLLLPLPGDRFAAEDVVEVHVGKTPYVRYDLNDYSVPHTAVRRTLTVRATRERVRILDGAVVLAEHARSYDRERQIEDPAHVAALVSHKRASRADRATDRLQHALPRSTQLLVAAAEHGRNLGSVTAQLIRLLDAYGPDELDAAIAEALERGVPHPQAVRQCLERRRQEKGLPPPVALRLPDDPRLRDVVVRPHALESYDVLAEETDE
jgi:transposase